MTFAARTFQGAVGAGVVAPTNALLNTSATTGIRSAVLQMQPDGSVTYTNASGDTQWYSPITAGIGSSFYVQLDLVTTSFTTITGGIGSPLQMNVLRGWTFSNTTSTTEAIGTYTLKFFSDAGGTILVGQSGGSWDIGYKP